MDEEGPTVTDYASLLRNQLVYKVSVDVVRMLIPQGYLIRGNTLQSVLMLMLPHFRKPRRDDKDDRIISLCLHIVRNMLAVKDLIAPDSATGDKEELSTLQSALIVQLEQLKFFELFVIFAKGAGRSQYNAFNTLILDILHLIYRGVRPHDLAVDQKKVRHVHPLLTPVVVQAIGRHAGERGPREGAGKETRRDKAFSIWHHHHRNGEQAACGAAQSKGYLDKPGNRTRREQEAAWTKKEARGW